MENVFLIRVVKMAVYKNLKNAKTTTEAFSLTLHGFTAVIQLIVSIWI